MTREFNVQYSDHGVPSQILQRPLLEEHIRLVDQNDGFPRSGDIEDPLKGSIKTCSRRPQVTPTNDMQRAPDVFARRFRREGLSNSRWAEEIDDQIVCFAFDEVVESNFLMVRFDERLEEVLAVVGEDKVSECVGVPIDIANSLDVEFPYEEKVNFARETEEKEALTPHFIHETEAEDNSGCEEQVSSTSAVVSPNWV
jgi:hypothetical protein